jgi:phosphate-selective porin OprO and OprP
MNTTKLDLKPGSVRTLKRFGSNLLLAAALTVGTAGSAMAGYDVNSRIDALEHELRELKAQMLERDGKLAELEAGSTNLADLPKFDSRKLQITSRDGNWSIRFGGRLMLDAFLAEASRTGAADTSGGGAEIRRARFFVSGKVAGDWKYKLQIDFASNGVAIKDAYISTKVAGLKAIFGNHKEPQGLEQQTSSKYVTFMERAMVSDTFAAGRQLGASLGASGENFTLRGGIFTSGIDNGSDTTTTDLAFTARGTYAPIVEDRQTVHLGVSGTYRTFDDNSGPRIRLRNFHNGTRYVDTGATVAEGQTTLGAEAAVVFGPFSAQGEYYMSTLEGNGTGAADVDFSGWYAMASYFLTGESRPYNTDKGVFGRVKGDGAIEIAARYEMIDMEDAGFGTAASETTALTVGVNYYFNPYVRAMLNYGNAEYDFTAAAGTADTEVDFVATRLQLDF